MVTLVITSVHFLREERILAYQSLLDERLPFSDETQVSVELWSHTVIVLVFTAVVEEGHVDRCSEWFTMDFFVSTEECLLVIQLVFF